MRDRDAQGRPALPRSEADPRVEIDLLAQFAAGEAAAAATLYRRHAPVIARLIARLGVADPSDVDDLVQTTFLEAVRSVERFQGESSVRTWLVAIALNQTRMLQRSRGRARRGLLLISADQPERRGPHEDLVETQELRRLRAALEKLSALQRETLVLCELEGIPGADVASILRVPVATVWRRVHDAKVSLRRLLERDDEPGPSADPGST